MNGLEGRVAVVTGAASGIGLAISGQLAAAGARVVMADINREGVEAAAEDVRRNGTEVAPVELDVRDSVAVERVADFAVERFGSLHIAVNNAGVVNGGPAWEIGLDEWRRVLDVDLWGVIHGVRAFVPRILETADEGHVVNVASMAAVLPQRNIAPYTVAKHGVLGLSDVLRLDLARVGAAVGVSVVLPGAVRTGMNPLGSVEPGQVAANVIDAIRRARDYVFTDDHSIEHVRSRFESILGARRDVLTG